MHLYGRISKKSLELVKVMVRVPTAKWYLEGWHSALGHLDTIINEHRHILWRKNSHAQARGTVVEKMPPPVCGRKQFWCAALSSNGYMARKDMLIIKS